MDPVTPDNTVTPPVEPPIVVPPQPIATTPTPASVSFGMSGTEALSAEATAKSRKRMVRLLIVVPSVLVLLGAAVLALVFFGLLPIGKFKTVTYDNGNNQRFQMLFYPSYIVKKSPVSTLNTQEIASKISLNGLYPLVFFISKATKTPSAAIMNCTSATFGKSVMKVTNKATGNVVNLCGLSAPNQPKISTIDTGVLKSGNDYYAIVIDQDADLTQINGNEAAAQAALKKIDLKAYNDDIATIVASIKPLP